MVRECHSLPVNHGDQYIERISGIFGLKTKNTSGREYFFSLHFFCVFFETTDLMYFFYLFKQC